MEKTKVGKKAKHIEDLLGLDPLIGLGPEESAAEFCSNGSEDSDAECCSNGPVPDVDLNSIPILGTGNISVDDGPGGEQTDVFNFSHLGEVEATIALGGKLGANLCNSHDLIVNSIANEGLQGGKS